jgi:DDE superfamily endonuclease
MIYVLKPLYNSSHTYKMNDIGSFLATHPELLGQMFMEEMQNTYKVPKGNLSRRRAAPRNRNRGYALLEMDNLSASEFRRMFRLSREAFYWLLLKIKMDLQPKASLRQRLHFDREITAKTKLAITLRWLAGGSYLDIYFAFGVAISTFFKSDGILWGTIAAIDNNIDIGFPLNDIQKLEEISEGFSGQCKRRMTGCVMAMDGWVMKTRCPNITEVTNQICYRNRKGVWGLVIFAGCDHVCRFIMFSVKCPGSTNDCIAWELTKLFQEVVVKKKLPPEYYFICDEAVPANEFVLSPFGGRNIRTWRDSFNYHLSSMRQSIERAFGLLTRRWGIFWRPLQCGYGRWHLIARVCAKLHNICIDFGILDLIGTMAEDYAEGDSAEIFMNEYQVENVGAFPNNADNSSLKRLQITEYLKQQGYRRPPHARCNSKA